MVSNIQMRCCTSISLELFHFLKVYRYETFQKTIYELRNTNKQRVAAKNLLIITY